MLLQDSSVFLFAFFFYTFDANLNYVSVFTGGSGYINDFGKMLSIILIYGFIY